MNKRAVLIGGSGAVVATAGFGAATFRGTGSMQEYNDSVSKSRAALAETSDLRNCIGMATLAANSHNVQAWSFHIDNNQIQIRPDYKKRTAIVDPDDHHFFVSLGCAAENLSLVAAAGGFIGEFSFDSSQSSGLLFNFRVGKKIIPPLLAAITQRQSTRNIYDGKIVPASDLALLFDAAKIPGVDVVLINDRPKIDRLRDIVISANTVQMSNAAYLRELKSWLRYNPHEALTKGDGLYSATSGSPNLPDWLGQMMVDLTYSAKSENDKYSKQIDSSSGIAVFASQIEDPEHWTMVGRCCQRFALQATALGLKTAFMNQPVEVAKFRPDLAGLIGMPGRRPDIVMRFGYGPAMPYSTRRPLDSVLV